MGPKQKIRAEANAGNTSRPHDESPHGGGRRPPHIMWPATHHVARYIFSICLRLCFMLSPHIAFSDFASNYIVFQGRLRQ